MTLVPRPDLVPEDALRFTFNGQAALARPGATIGGALAAQGMVALRQTRNDRPRGIHCGMGACFDCLVTVDGRTGVRACLEKVAEGMTVASASTDAESLTDLAPSAAGPLPRRTIDVLVVGAGPAGATAAALLAEAGASIIVCDERSAPGGQYFKERQVGDPAAPPADAQFAEGRALADRLYRSGAELWTGSTVWYASATEGVGVLRPEGACVVEPRFTVIATGASERPVPLPGWTLPGVMTTGGLQGLVRAQGAIPPGPIVIAGSGPLNIQLALELAQVGHPPAAVIDTGPGPSMAALGPLARMLAADWRLSLSGIAQLAALRRAGVPVLWRSEVAAIGGSDEVKVVEVRGPGGSRALRCRTIAINMGFQPQAELARQFGCRMAYVDIAAGHVAVATAEDGATSLPTIYAIGDGAAIGGSRVALAQGALAAGSIAAALGLAPPAEAITARAGLRRARRFQAALWSLFTQPRFDTAMIADTTPVCRCEEVTAGAVRQACHTASPTLAAVKRLTRAGMGRCQGRFCAGPLTRLVAAEGGPVPDASAFFAPRPPARPVPLGAIAVEKAEWGGHRRSAPPAVSPRVALKREPFGRVDTDVVVIGAGVVGSTVAWELARSGVAVTVVDRHEPNVQASGANAGSLHVQLLSFDFGAKARAGGRPAAEVLRIAPVSIRLWKEIEAKSGVDFEMATPGGVMVGESEADMAFLAQKTALEKSYGIDSELIGSNELRGLEPFLAPHFTGATLCRDEGKINPLRATPAIVAMAKSAGARFETFAGVTGITREGSGWRVETEAGTIVARRVVNCAGGWASRVAAMALGPIPVQGAPLQMIVTEPGPKLVQHLVAHASRHLSLKQADTGGLVIGGAWPASLDPATGASHVEMASIEGNAWVAAHVLPAAARLRIVRVWAAMNIDIDGAPILGEMPGAPGFFNCVTSNGYSLAPVVARITRDLIVDGRSDLPHAMFGLDRF
jgi:glycine/D-amino acid oxidase-like deaminating enzyme